jgi:hypothetical protein
MWRVTESVQPRVLDWLLDVGHTQELPAAANLVETLRPARSPA